MTEAREKLDKAIMDAVPVVGTRLYAAEIEKISDAILAAGFRLPEAPGNEAVREKLKQRIEDILIDHDADVRVDDADKLLADIMEAASAFPQIADDELLRMAREISDNPSGYTFTSAEVARGCIALIERHRTKADELRAEADRWARRAGQNAADVERLTRERDKARLAFAAATQNTASAKLLAALAAERKRCGEAMAIIEDEIERMTGLKESNDLTEYGRGALDEAKRLRYDIRAALAGNDARVSPDQQGEDP